jgi:hypothetical protein
MRDPDLSGRWDDLDVAGRYVGDEPVPFIDEIARAVHAHRPSDDIGLYIGCG